jgi:hypothetical protein
MRHAFDWLFRNRETGAITVFQPPNFSLWIFIVAVVGRRVSASGTAPHTAAEWIATAALAWWALDEIGRGVNPWRRVLGFAILASLLVSLV